MARALSSVLNNVFEVSNLGTTLNQTVFTSNGTFTVPTLFRGFLYVSLAAGGGGGGDFYSTCFGGGGGGAASFYRWPVWVDKAVTSSVSVVVGTGGAGSTTGNGGDGNPSNFGTFLKCYGGAGGEGNTNANNGGAGGSFTYAKTLNDASLDVGGGSSATGFGDPGMGILCPNFPAFGEILFGACSGGGSGAGDSNNSADSGAPAYSNREEYNSPKFLQWSYFSTHLGGGTAIGAPLGVKSGTYRVDGRGGTTGTTSASDNCPGGGGSLGRGGQRGATVTDTSPTYGGGGCGAKSGYTAQSGANGLCVVEWFA